MVMAVRLYVIYTLRVIQLYDSQPERCARCSVGSACSTQASHLFYTHNIGSSWYRYIGLYNICVVYLIGTRSKDTG